MRKTRILFLIAIAWLPGLLAAGQVKFTTVAGSQQIGKGEYFQVEFVIENAKDIDKFTPPGFSGFRVMQEPTQSSGMSIVNGNVSQYQSLTFLLQPEKTGKFTVEGASAMIDGKKMRSNSITVTVTNAPSGNKGNSPNPNPNNPFSRFFSPDPTSSISDDIRRESVLRPGEDVKEKIRKNLFVKVQVDRSDCYVGEPIVATYKLYSRLNSEFRVTKSPSLNGFSLYDMVDPSTEPSSVEKLGGKSFVVRILRKAQLVPLQPGTIDLDPVEVENTVRLIKTTGRPAQRGSGDAVQDLFDQLSEDSQGTEVEENATLDTKPLTITVKPLPENNKPANFNGAVGNFSIASALVSRKVNAQDEADLKVTVKGSGNLFVVNAPPVNWPAGMDAFNPTAKENINKTTVPLSGTKTFDYIFTTRAPGHYTIPPVALSYFDPVVQAYKSIQSNPVDFEVMPAAKKTGPPATGIVSAASEGSGGFKELLQRHLESLFAILILSGLAFYLLRQNIRMKRAEQAKKGSTAEASGTQTGGGAGGAGGGVGAGVVGAAGSSGQRGSGADGSSGSGGAGGEGRSPGAGGSGGMDSRAERAEWMAMAFDPLSDIKERLENGDHPGFYRELNRAMWKAVADKLDLPASELNKYNVARKLETKGWDAPSILSLEHLLNECEMNLYTPDHDTYNMQQLLRQAESLLRILVSNTSY